MDRDGGHPTIRVTELLVGATLAYFPEAQRFKERDDLAGFQGRDAPHGSGDLEGMSADELRFDLGLTVLKQEVNDLAEVYFELVERAPLRMGARPAGDVAHKDPGVRISLDNSGESTHEELSACGGA